jgi:hypothetical protein
MSEIRTNAVRLPSAWWPWLDRIGAAWTMVMILAFLGILTFAAVREAAKKCGREPNYITDERNFRISDENGTYLTDGWERLECRTVWGDFGRDFR